MSVVSITYEYLCGPRREQTCKRARARTAHSRSRATTRRIVSLLIEWAHKLTISFYSCTVSRRTPRATVPLYCATCVNGCRRSLLSASLSRSAGMLLFNYAVLSYPLASLRAALARTSGTFLKATSPPERVPHASRSVPIRHSASSRVSAIKFVYACSSSVLMSHTLSRARS